MVDVIVAEPNPLLRTGLHAVLAGQADIRILAEIEDESALAAALQAGAYDVMLAGLGLLRHVGADMVRALRRRHPGGGLLVHSYEWDRAFAREATGFGAAGYFSHECSPEELHAAVLDVAAGRPFITRSLGAELADAACFRAVRLDTAPLSAREERIFKMLALGMSLSGIAAQIGMPLADVIACKWRIACQIDVPDAGALVRHAIEQACRERPYAEPEGRHRVA